MRSQESNTPGFPQLLLQALGSDYVQVWGLWVMGYGLWFMVYGLWFMVYGLWFIVLWFMIWCLFLADVNVDCLRCAVAHTIECDGNCGICEEGCCEVRGQC